MQATKFNNEDFGQIKQAHLSRGILYEDESFQCNASSVQCLVGDSPTSPEFKRPNDLCENPILRQVGPPSAICRGTLSNVNIVLALSVVAERAELLEVVC